MLNGLKWPSDWIVNELTPLMGVSDDTETETEASLVVAWGDIDGPQKAKIDHVPVEDGYNETTPRDYTICSLYFRRDQTKSAIKSV